MILVDTCVWIDHLRVGDQRLVELLNSGDVLGHPFVVGELALGNLRRRDGFLNELRDLRQASVAEDDEVFQLIGRRALFGRGIGYVDAHLLAAALLTPDTKLWTHDRCLRKVAIELGLAAMPSH